MWKLFIRLSSNICTIRKIVYYKILRKSIKKYKSAFSGLI
jgi:hypothetical protein